MDPRIDAAPSARGRAPARFPNFRAGPAPEDNTGRIPNGGNAENATYGLTACAGRVPVFKFISQVVRKLRQNAVAADTDALTPPCGAWPPDSVGALERYRDNFGESRWQDRNAALPRPMAVRCCALVKGLVLWNRHSRPCFGLCLLAGALFAEPVDLIWSARYVITMDAQRRGLENGAVAIRGERIIAAGTKMDIDRRYP